MRDAERIAMALEDLLAVYLPEGVTIWLRARQEQFGGLTALQVLRMGRVDDFVAAVERLR